MVAIPTSETATTAPATSIPDAGASTNLRTYRMVQRTAGADPQIAYTCYEPASPVSELTLVLLHGAAHDERCWQVHWAPHLAERGWRCLTLSYRAHGASTWSRPVHQATLDDYAADVVTVLAAESLDPRQVILIGHSLGGGVAQRVAEQHAVAGLVLVSSLALGRWLHEALPRLPGQFLRHPRVYPRLRRDPSALFTSPRLARASLFDAWTAEDTVQWYLDHCWCHESGRAMQQLLTARPQPLRTNRLLFVGGRKDASVSLRSIRASAAWLRAPLFEVEAPHDLMLAGDWLRAVEAVHTFAQQAHVALVEEHKRASGGMDPAIQRLLAMPMASHATRLPIQVAGMAGEIAAWVFAPPAQALGPEPVVLHLYPGGTYDKRYWHFVPHPQDGSYSFAQYMAEQYRCIVIACDHLGTGESTRPENGFALTLDVLADAQAQVAEHLRTHLTAGTLAPDLPPLPHTHLVGIGHSMGALILHRVQARSQSYDAVGFLGWTHGEAQYGQVDQAALGRVLMPNEHGYVVMTPAQRPAQRPFFYREDVPLEIVRADEQQCTDLPGGVLADIFRTGSVKDDAAQIRVPVFLGFGEQDISRDPRQDEACYPQAEVTLFELAGAAHCHNLASTRQELWKALGWWLQRRVRVRTPLASERAV